MESNTKKRSMLGSALTTAGGVIGVLGIIIMRIGLKATITPDTHNVVLIRSVLSVGGFVAFGLAVGLIFAGALIGRRSRASAKNEGPVRATAQTDPNLIPDAFGFPDSTSTYDSSGKPLSERQNPSSSS